MRQLTGVRHYFNYLITENKRSDNPAAGVFIKGQDKKTAIRIIKHGRTGIIIPAVQFAVACRGYKKIMLGLFIYQGLTIGELLKGSG